MLIKLWYWSESFLFDCGLYRIILHTYNIHNTTKVNTPMRQYNTIHVIHCLHSYTACVAIFSLGT